VRTSNPPSRKERGYGGQGEAIDIEAMKDASERSEASQANGASRRSGERVSL
jgi:hypothetical protein